MQKNSNSVSDLQPIMLGWLIALLLVSGVIAISRGAAYVIEHMIETRSLEYLMPAAILAVALVFVMFVSYRFMPAYWRRNVRGYQVLICKFRGSRKVIVHFLLDGTLPHEFVLSRSDSALCNGRYLDYWLGGWFKPSGRFVCVRNGCAFDQGCRIDRVGWSDRNFLRRLILVRDQFGNKVSTSAGRLIMLAEVVGGTAFDWREAPDRLVERLASINRLVEPRADSRHTFN